MKNQIKNYLILPILFICSILIAQDEEKIFFQIINKGELIKITEKDNILEYKKLDFKIDEDVFLLAYDSKSSSLNMLTEESKTLIKVDLDGRIISREKVEDLPKTCFAISTIDDNGNMYLGGFINNSFYKVNVNEKRKYALQIKLEKRTVSYTHLTLPTIYSV